MGSTHPAYLLLPVDRGAICREKSPLYPAVRHCIVASHSSPGIVHRACLMEMTTLRSEISVTKWTVRGCIAVSAIAGWLAVHALMNPATPTGRGRSRWVLEFVTILAGDYANALLWSFVAVFALCFARFVWRRTAKVPSDRWWKA